MTLDLTRFDALHAELQRSTSTQARTVRSKLSRDLVAAWPEIRAEIVALRGEVQVLRGASAIQKSVLKQDAEVMAAQEAELVRLRAIEAAGIRVIGAWTEMQGLPGSPIEELRAALGAGRTK